MKPIFFMFLLAALSLSANYAPADNAWEQMLNESELTFTPHADYKPVKVKENRDMPYHYALKHKKAKFEVRFHVASIPKMKEQIGDVSPLDVNTMHKTLLMTAVMNISQSPDFFLHGKLPQLDEFPREDVKSEFNADRGYTTVFTIYESSEYGKGYKWGAIYLIHRQDVADVTVCFLADSKETLQEHMMDMFYAVQFKK